MEVLPLFTPVQLAGTVSVTKILIGQNKCLLRFHSPKKGVGRSVKSFQYKFLILSFSRLAGLFFFFLQRSPCAQEDVRMRPFSICPPVGSHIPFSGRLCMPAPSVCFWTPRLSLGHPGSFTSVHDLKCMRTQTAPLV